MSNDITWGQTKIFHLDNLINATEEDKSEKVFLFFLCRFSVKEEKKVVGEKQEK